MTNIIFIKFGGF